MNRDIIQVVESRSLKIRPISNLIFGHTKTLGEIQNWIWTLKFWPHRDFFFKSTFCGTNRLGEAATYTGSPLCSLIHFQNHCFDFSYLKHSFAVMLMVGTSHLHKQNKSNARELVVRSVVQSWSFKNGIGVCHARFSHKHHMTWVHILMTDRCLKMQTPWPLWCSRDSIMSQGRGDMDWNFDLISHPPNPKAVGSGPALLPTPL